MKDVTRFDLEEQMMQCWNVVDDMRTVATMSEKDRSSALEGLAHLYHKKFETMQETFETLVHNNAFPAPIENDSYSLMPMDNVTRFEVIDQYGRQLTHRVIPNTVKLSLQDDARTLKVFLTTEKTQKSL